MPASLNIPVPESAYRQPRLVLKNRRARRNRTLAKPELSLVVTNAQAQPELPPLPAAVVISEPGVEPPATPATNHYLSQAVLLDWLGTQPVAFHRPYVDVCGSVTAAVWLSMVLSLLDGRASQQVDAQGVFHFTLSANQCEAQTGLTDREQRKAQQQLVTSGLLKVEAKKAGQQIPAFALEMNALTQKLLAHSESLAELIRNSAVTSPKPLLDVANLERRAQVRASRRRA